MLVTVHHIGFHDVRPYRRGERVRSLTAYVPRAADHAHFKMSLYERAIVDAERQKTGGNALGHVPCQLEGVTFGSPNDSSGAE